MSTTTLIIPTSKDLMSSLGDSSASASVSSGWLIGCAWVLCGLAAIPVRVLAQQWDHARQKRTLIACFIGVCAALCVYGVSADPAILFTQEVPAQLRIAGLFFSRLVISMAYAPTLFLAIIHWKSTPKIEMVPSSITIICFRTMGLGLGPMLGSIIDAALAAAVGHSTQASFALPAFVMAIFWAALAVYAALRIPASIDNMIRHKSAVDNDAIPPGAEGKQVLAYLPDQSRKAIWRKGMIYGIERAFSVSAVEAATSLVLELEFNWGTAQIGMAVGLAFVLAGPVGLIIQALRSSLTDAHTLILTSCVCVISTLLFFPGFGSLIGISQEDEVYLVLAADCLLFPCAYMASGIMDAFARQCVLENTFFSIENYELLGDFVFQDAVARFLGPPIARYILTWGGRYNYAIFQTSLAIMGCTCCMIVAKDALRSPGRGEPMLDN